MYGLVQVAQKFHKKNFATSSRTKHHDIRYKYVKEYVEDGVVKIIFDKSKDNDSDIMTKNLTGGISFYSNSSSFALVLLTFWSLYYIFLFASTIDIFVPFLTMDSAVTLELSLVFFGLPKFLRVLLFSVHFFPTNLAGPLYIIVHVC